MNNFTIINQSKGGRKKEEGSRWNLLISSFCNYNFLYGSCIQLLALLDSNGILFDLESIIYFFLAEDQEEYVVSIVYVVISNTMWSPFQLRCLAQVCRTILIRIYFWPLLLLKNKIGFLCYRECILLSCIFIRR